ncbi:MAG: hydroxymethylglutaryl-CoA reductase, degradative [Anaerolineae bacterium]|jgi:hydroxymethylglutaryl-CoA reductase|nr:hydroxymethylglutaryl-CoA reductase, degradative [Anaerolineae bacterium]
MNDTHNSQLSKFYKRSLQERRDVIQTWVGSGRSVGEVLDGNLRVEQADSMVENAVGIYSLPLGIATNFLINQRDYLVPMVIEEPSVIAAASHAAKLFREGGGFHTSSDAPVMIGQIQVLDVPDLIGAVQRLDTVKAMLIAKANEVSGSILKRGGGVIDLEIRVFEDTEVGPMVIVHLLMDTRDAMGANAINTAVEYIAPDVAEISGGRTHLRILSNLTDRRKAKAWGIVPASALETENKDGYAVIKAIVEASVFAEVDPYRAATHNKGVMNGIDAVVMATGNDWRAVEAGAHAFAARRGAYTSLSTFRQNEAGDLYAEIELPLAVGIVGGATRVHPVAQLALDILGVTSAQELAEVIVAVGLAQNFAAVKALAGEGIQKGHMRMHARQIAMAAGATVEMVPLIVDTLIRENNIRLERATALVKQLNETEQDKR